MKHQDQLELDGFVQQPKALGAYYTDAQIADFLVNWAVRTPQDTILDPSFGGGVFLRSACKRLRKLNGRPDERMFGIEIDPLVHKCISQKLVEEFNVKPEHLKLSDFFALRSTDFNPVSVVIGNPPFIRYQRFSGDSRANALRRAAEAGVKISELASSWVPFLIHSISLLENGGRLAMVVPAEIGHARYAHPLLGHLGRTFKSVTFLTFRKRLFPDLSEDTMLLLAEAKGNYVAQFRWKDFEHAGVLKDFPLANWRLPGTRTLDGDKLTSGSQRLTEQFLPKRARELYAALKQSNAVDCLGNIADVGIGYVTGANGFFHLNDATIREYDIPSRFLTRAVRRGRDLAGLRYTEADWSRVDASYLLDIGNDEDLPVGLKRYLETGVKAGVTEGYKCRTRSPWFKVPHVYLPDAFLSYMSGYTPRLVSNEANVVAPNSLHILRLHPRSTVTRNALTALWQTSLTKVSVEIEGHPLGGGMLKLEPTEAERVLVARAAAGNPQLNELALELDAMVRSGCERDAQLKADEEILMKQLGLSRAECTVLEKTTDSLRSRRVRNGLP
jgi:adenine-specific DNA-methyltransferase